MLFHYNIANGWAYLQRLTKEINSSEFWSFDSPEFDKQIINLRLALKYSVNVSDDFNKTQILTNLGNLFSHVGRFSEAQIYWHLALNITPDFPMAIGNIGFGLVHYAKVLYDKRQQVIFLQTAYNYLNQSVDLELYKEAKLSFKNMIKKLEDYLGKELLLKLAEMNKPKLGRTKSERIYRKWCLDNRLFLNPLNDLSVDTIASHDSLFLLSMILEFNQPPIYQGIFNQIKQEYVSARFLMYEGIMHKGLHFSDRKNLQMDTLDYATYSLSIEKIKVAFRTCYSVFDKIGYLLNEYLHLGINPDKVTFKRIWYSFKNNKPVSLNPIISNSPNWSFRGLYWLSKDLDEKNFASSIEPDAQEIASIRNFIEHKSFKTVEFGLSGLGEDKLTYTITRPEFESKTIKLFTLVRSAIIYLSLGIYIEEYKKRKLSVPILPIDFISLRDDFKY
jgi:hypothetical protein